MKYGGDFTGRSNIGNVGTCEKMLKNKGKRKYPRSRPKQKKNYLSFDWYIDVVIEEES